MHRSAMSSILAQFLVNCDNGDLRILNTVSGDCFPGTALSVLLELVVSRSNLEV